MKPLWKCAKCKREFAKVNQSHSCVSYPLENHFKGKIYAKELFTHLTDKVEKKIGQIKIESLPCCIHFVGSYTFGAVFPMKDKIRIDFRTDFPIKSKRVWKMFQMSPNRYLYYFEIKNKKDIDTELLGWIKKAYGLNKNDI
ncbi:hypothetical protein A2Z67_01445 [Candidatus Woesebacteria bacterium RBG_13_36_22]|uniref:DUF5655 domain-containing protein n=1 Tax=Candidatus Woesebacteria bacterium RBG_13_36_22 TaxID=1802478 RepID=A0A1F7WZS2_9BACT|nr:MAG: hypothetical protein A2Z67_01445 [Candidatus Woesebacteria bacterium RBG_13_36_22]